MERKLWGLFSGAQLTVMFVSVMAVAVPGTLWATFTGQNVAITDIGTGKTAAVNAGRKLYVTDAYLDQSLTPGSFVHIFAFSSPSCTASYTVPAGKALVIQSASFYLHKIDPSISEIEDDLYYGVSGSCSNMVGAATGDRAHETVSQSFGGGIAFSSGKAIALSGYNSGGSAMLYGYLVPAAQVPPGVAMASSVRASPGHPATMITQKR